MKYVQITVDGVTYTLRQQNTGEWAVTNTAPYISGEYPVAVILTTEDGQKIQVDISDEMLQRALTLIVTEGNTIHGERMLNYYPQVIQQLIEFKALIKSEGFEVDIASNQIELLVNEKYLTTMGEKRISEWEKALGMVYESDDTLQDRRDAIIARIRGQGKLNTSLINAIVNAFTGGTAISYIKNSVLYVKITPPPNNKQYKFENVRRELIKKVPAHLGLEVLRNYATWGDVKDNYASWETVSQMENWEELKLLITPQ